MTDRLSDQLKMEVCNLLCRGMSYTYIAETLGISKSSISNIYKDLVQGLIPYFENGSELTPLLREIAVEVREGPMTIEETYLGVQIVRHYGELGQTPSSIEGFIAMAERLAQNEGEAPTVLRAAMNMHRLEASTGLTYPELEAKAAELDQQCKALNQQIAQKQSVVKELAATEKVLEERKKEVLDLEKKKSNLLQEIDVRNRHIEKQTDQTQTLEARSHTAEVRLASTRQAEERAAAMGLTTEQFPKLVQRLEPLVLQHQGPINEVIDRLVADLEEAGSCATLKARRIAGQKTYKKLLEDVSNARARKSGLEAEITELVVTRGQLTSQISIMQDQAVPRLNHAASQAVALVEKAGEALVGTQSEMISKTIDLGRTVAELDETLRTMAWMGSLQQVIEGIGAPTHAVVKLTLGVVLTGFSQWLEADRKELPFTLLSNVYTLLATVNQWKVDEKNV